MFVVIFYTTDMNNCSKTKLYKLYFSLGAVLIFAILALSGVLLARLISMKRTNDTSRTQIVYQISGSESMQKNFNALILILVMAKH